MKSKFRNIGPALVLGLCLLGITSLDARADFIVDPDPGGEKLFLDMAKNVTSSAGQVGGQKSGVIVDIDTLDTSTVYYDSANGYATIKPVQTDPTNMTLLNFTPATGTLFKGFSFRAQLEQAGDITINVWDSDDFTQEPQSFTFTGLPANANVTRLGIISTDHETIYKVQITSISGFKEVKQIEFSNANFMYGDFGSSGLWMWDGTTWSKLSPTNPENMAISGSFLYGDFGAGGLWMWNGTTWSKLSPYNPENIEVSGSFLYGDFGSSGIWVWDGTTWSKITSSNPENIEVSGSFLYGDFGSGGLWMWDGTVWSKLTPANPENLESSAGSPLYADFGQAIP